MSTPKTLQERSPSVGKVTKGEKRVKVDESSARRVFENFCTSEEEAVDILLQNDETAEAAEKAAETREEAVSHPLWMSFVAKFQYSTPKLTAIFRQRLSNRLSLSFFKELSAWLKFRSEHFHLQKNVNARIAARESKTGIYR